MRLGLLGSVILCTLAYGCATPPDEPKTADQPATAVSKATPRTGSRLPGYDYGSGSSSVSESSREAYEDARRINTTNPYGGN